jgi:hypothetical protein
LIVNGIKAIENRTWNTDLRGQFMVHVSKTIDMRADALARRQMEATRPLIKIPPLGDLPRGGLVGTAELVGVRTPERHPTDPFALSGCYGFELRGARDFGGMLIPCKGQLGFFTHGVDPRGLLRPSNGVDSVIVQRRRA